MSTNSPFLAQFTKPPSTEEAKANSNYEKSTKFTKVARETTDDS